MRSHFSSRPKLATALTLVSMFVTGCAHTLHLKVVDAKSGEPLAGVSTLWREDSAYNLLTGRRHQTRPNNLMSGQDGLITVNTIHKKWVSRFVFSHVGYATLYGIYTPESLELARGVRPDPLPQDRFILLDPRFLVGPSNGCFLIPMQK